MVLWSPGYFTRLWTAFELSAFLREDGIGKDIDFAPNSLLAAEKAVGCF